MQVANNRLRVFLCHASVDKPLVKELYRYLKRRGIQPWLDAIDLIPGQNWQAEIPKALNASDAIIICLTKNSIDKEGYVQTEIKFALDKALEMPAGRIFLIPARLEDCEVPYSLKDYQWVDLFREDGYSRLMKALKLRASQLNRSDLEKTAQDDIITAEVQQVEVDEKSIEEAGKLTADSKPRRSWNTKIIALVGLAIAVVGSMLGLPLMGKWFDISSVPTTTTATSATTEIIDTKGVQMVFVPSGEFTMGNDQGDPDEKPAHPVILNAYYIDKYEVTNALYKACVDSGICQSPQNKSSYTHSNYYGGAEFEDYPVIYVNWNMAKTYCEWRVAQLPTEAQWEKAARGVDGRVYPWGNSFDGAVVNFCDVNCASDWSDRNYDDGYEEIAPVGSYPRGTSPYGVYNMAGNVYEWVTDWYSASYYRMTIDGNIDNPLGPSIGQEHVMRGASWKYEKDSVSTFFRNKSAPTDVYNDVGFRCAKDATP